MKLYIGNTSRMVVTFFYRVPGENWDHLNRPTLQPGTQMALPYDLDQHQIDSIVLKQHGAYGILPADEANRAKGYHGLCWSVDKTISNSRIEALLLSNQDELQRQGKEIRKNAAVAANAMVADIMRQTDRTGDLDELRVTIQQVNDDPRDDSPKVNEGYRVRASEQGGGKAPQRPRRKAA